MQALLSQLSTLPHVVGCLVCSPEGRLLAHAFPPDVEGAQLQGVAAALADRTAALESALGTLGAVDLRFARARVVVKSIPGARLLVLCAPSVNLELLSLAASRVLVNLERLSAGGSTTAATFSAAAGPPSAGQLHEAVRRIEVLIERSGKDPFRLRGQIALKAGFSLDLIGPETPDDPGMLQSLRAAASAVLGQPV
jgi:predicted regulator of Ras-like GTPase activity (Roadblock/LC7/MglB family)